MLLKSIQLKDFRLFKGKQPPIIFSTDLERNVTVIMGGNGSGKTTLAQAFTWCLYGDTDFEDKNMLCKITAQSMSPKSEEIVWVEIELVHNNTEYTVSREQRYFKNSDGSFKRPGNTVQKISFKNKDGQRKFIDDLETEIRMKEILPKELSKYFFFDGERIDNMGKEIRKGKSREFAQAVKGLLGLGALIAALDHLKKVARSYDKSYDAGSDIEIAQYTKEIEQFEVETEKIQQRLIEIENEEILMVDKCAKLSDKIRENADSEELAKEREKTKQKMNGLIQLKEDSIKSMLAIFNSKSSIYLSQKLMKDALESLSEADKLDKGIPDVHARTIEFLIKRGSCLCGNKIEVGNDVYKKLNKVLDYIPPQSVGSSIGQFVRECELKTNSVDTFYEDFSDKYSIVRDFDNNYAKIDGDLSIIEEKLKNMLNVGILQKDLMRYEKKLREIQEERDDLNQQKGGLETSKNRRITERQKLTLKDENNRKIEVYKAYTQHVFNSLDSFYKEKETETRAELEENINKIFKSIYKGGFSLTIDEKYNIQIIADDLQETDNEIETSTAQSISVIFAFIAGVIKMARESKISDNKMLVSEPYPLVMDAPLSAFDKTRIKTVGDTLPEVAEQVIILIKDTDGEIAEENMGNKVGKKYLFDKKNEFETYVISR